MRRALYFQRSGMMLISSKNWHYRWYRWFWHRKDQPPPEPKSLCTYFWKVMLALVLQSLQVIVALSMLALVLIFMVVILIEVPWGLLAFPIAATLAGIVWGIVRLVKHRSRKAVKPPEPSKPPSLLHSYFKAKKAKVCPRIEMKWE